MSRAQRLDSATRPGNMQAQFGHGTSGGSGTEAQVISSRSNTTGQSNTLIPRDFLGPKTSKAGFHDLQPLRQQEASATSPWSSRAQAQSAPASDVRIGSNESLRGGQHSSPSQGSLLNPKTRATISPPESPTSVSSSHRQNAGTMPRTSSIDSAISTISNSSSAKAALDSKDPSPTEIRNLIATAGSAENLILHLLRDKNHAASQNSQLWKLVDKQRALLLGLNKDLERLTKEKEKYKRKVKELQPPTGDEIDERLRKDSQSPKAKSEVRESPVSGQPSQTDSLREQSRAVATPLKTAPSTMENSPIDPAMMPSPLHPPPQQQRNGSSALTAEPRPPTPADSPPSQTRVVGMVNDTNGGAVYFDPKQGDRAKAMLSPLSLQPPLSQPSFALIEPSPLAEKPGKQFPASRKAPPAPLRLNQLKGMAVPPQGSPTSEEAEKAIDENGLIDESPKPDRGRRKTREEDDHDRELAVMKEREARSRSKKEKKPSLDSEEMVAQTVAQTVKPTGLPSLPVSPRFPPPPPNHSAPSTSVGSMLHPQTQGSTIERTLVAPPLSPGLPVSPRPTDRPVNSPQPRLPRDAAGPTLPMSPRNMTGGPLLSPRAPRYALHTPSNALPQPGTQAATTAVVSNRPLLSVQPPTDGPVMDSNQTLSPLGPPPVYRGLVSQAYPGLLLPPNALPSILVRVASSRLRPSRHSIIAAKPADDSAVFTLSVFSRANSKELWRIEKVISSLPQLDQKLRPVCNQLPPLPDRKLFNGQSPAMVDARREGLNGYFGDLLDTEMDERAAIFICEYLSTDVIEPSNDAAAGISAFGEPTQSIDASGKPKKTGYLTKRGKNFGGWKARFFMLDRPELRYFEAPGGQHLGTIKLPGAQIGKQSQSESPTQPQDNENQYRHAFLILEPKRKDSASLVRHVLCAESDAERDEWVAALLHYVDDDAAKHGDSMKVVTDGGRGTNQLKAISYEDTIPGTLPVMDSPNIDGSTEDSPTPPSSSSGHNNNNINISGPMNATVISDTSFWGNKSVSKEKESKKRSLFHFKQKNADVQPENSSIAHSQLSGESVEPVRAVFGLPLSEAVAFCPPVGVDVELPAVVYRCLEYLRVKQAANEEGLFRLSGSNLVIRTLKERFNTEGDFDFLADGEYYDVHAVASLFKTYLRELPTTVLTRELHLDFLHVLDLDDSAEKIAAYNGLVHRLPSVNYMLLRTLSEYLLEVVNNSDKNKMSSKNVAIVFSPTLNIPVPVLTAFLLDYEAIFERSVPSQQFAKPQQFSSLPDEIRSPRRQMFSDLPTPAYNQTAFNRSASTNGQQSINPMSLPDSSRPSTADVGFAPMQPAYEARSYVSIPQSLAPPQPRNQLLQQVSQQDQYGSLNHMIAPDNTLNAKAKRRESSMLFLG